MLLAADVGFVSFDDVSESITVSGFFDAVADALEHEPSGLLGNS
jgi:hypothetical protein